MTRPRLSPAAWAAIILAGLAIGGIASAHPGGLNDQGCHNDRKNGGYHCHRAPARQSGPVGFTSRGSSSTYYANCAAARRAGAAPVRRGQPGYGPHLDRDGDGVGCE